MKNLILGICLTVLALPLGAQETDASRYSLSFGNVPLNTVLERLQDITGKDITVDFGLNAMITASMTNMATADEATAFLIQALNQEGIRVEELDAHTLRIRGTPSLEPMAFDGEEEAVNPQDESQTPQKPLPYGERRQQRMQSARKAADSAKPNAADEQLKQHLQAYQMEVIREGLTPLDVALPASEGMTVPAEELPGTTRETGAAHAGE